MPVPCNRAPRPLRRASEYELANLSNTRRRADRETRGTGATRKGIRAPRLGENSGERRWISAGFELRKDSLNLVVASSKKGTRVRLV